ncbi:hypothetical protein [Pseudomonas sp. P8_250]|uniref:hypothetical protein n=1 Tax=Pseudomonas sp. P8_250 TaxID=3043446 RepID=UPI002A3668DD|nr:hypothetical protein [Pseudomonas sp. P8_250]MDX9668671.1 hypothetical protein [Pseudomonas sp. P8_250]
MTVIAIAICTTHSLSAEVQIVDSPEEAVAKFTNALDLDEGELIELIVCHVAPESNDSELAERAFESEVEKLFHAAVPEKFVSGYNWVESKTTGQG